MTFFHIFFRGHPGNRLVSHFSQWSQESPCAPEIRGNYSWKPSKAQILTPNHQKVTSILLVSFFGSARYWINISDEKEFSLINKRAKKLKEKIMRMRKEGLAGKGEFSVENLAFKKAFQLFRLSSFTVLVISSLLVSIIHQIYFLQTNCQG